MSPVASDSATSVSSGQRGKTAKLTWHASAMKPRWMSSKRSNQPRVPKLRELTQPPDELVPIGANLVTTHRSRELRDHEGA
jgi:hypothetical protein